MRKRVLFSVASVLSPIIGAVICLILGDVTATDRALQWLAMVGPTFTGMTIGVAFCNLAIREEMIEKEREEKDDERNAHLNRRRPSAYRRSRLQSGRSSKTA